MSKPRAPFSNVCPREMCKGECYGVSDDPTPRPIAPGMIVVCTKCKYCFTHDGEGRPREFTAAEIEQMERDARATIAAHRRHVQRSALRN